MSDVRCQICTPCGRFGKYRRERRSRYAGQRRGRKGVAYISNSKEIIQFKILLCVLSDASAKREPAFSAILPQRPQGVQI